jgi:hypothetical protein
LRGVDGGSTHTQRFVRQPRSPHPCDPHANLLCPAPKQPSISIPLAPHTLFLRTPTRKLINGVSLIIFIIPVAKMPHLRTDPVHQRCRDPQALHEGLYYMKLPHRSFRFQRTGCRSLREKKERLSLIVNVETSPLCDLGLVVNIAIPRELNQEFPIVA